jgi:acetyl-CoA carboxylase beta subunit
MRIALAIILLVVTVPLLVTGGVMVAAGMLSDHVLTREGWGLAAVSGVAGLAALVMGVRLLHAPRHYSR